MKRVVIYTRPYCPYCVRAKKLLLDKGVRFEEYAHVSKDEQDAFKARTGFQSFPQTYIGEAHVGGCDDLFALDGAGKLEALLAD